ncbi:MAG TPA: D-amino-acid transaminase, partial [Nitrospiria bacterium]
NIAFINGRFLPLSQAKVSAEDRGFQFGDGIYELIRTYHGRIFHLGEHLDRMEHSAKAIGLTLVYSRARWKQILARLGRLSRHPDAKLYIQITRGAAPRDHAYPRKVRPTVVVTARRLTPLPDAIRRNGVPVITVPDLRWGRCDIKSLNLLPNIMARQKARASGAFEALFVRDGLVLEGAGCNVFAVTGGRIVTPPRGPGILSGITREQVIELARASGGTVIEKDISLTDLMAADELFLTGTTVEILPVVRVDGKAIGDGRPGAVTFRLHRNFIETTGK